MGTSNSKPDESKRLLGSNRRSGSERSSGSRQSSNSSVASLVNYITGENKSSIVMPVPIVEVNRVTSYFEIERYRKLPIAQLAS